MKTSSFFLYKGPGRISIARRAPQGESGFRVFSGLAPGSWFLSVSQEEYRERFFREILGPLDPQKTWDRLHEMVAPHEPVLLCWEHLNNANKPEEWCHRTLVSEWFKNELGFIVPEIQIVESRKGVKPQEPGLF